MKASTLEESFLKLWALLAPDAPAPEQEHSFAKSIGRKWRFDCAWPGSQVAVELEGATWVAGRHTRGSGFAGDLEKYNAATQLGWRVLRYTGDDLKMRPVQVVEQIRALLDDARA